MSNQIQREPSESEFMPTTTEAACSRHALPTGFGLARR